MNFMKQAPVKWIASVLLIGLTLNFSGCGYLLHPERRGQTGGRIDPGIAVLDGLGLLLFVIPGVVAFVVDFSTGCIYRPSGWRGSLDPAEMRECRFDPHGATTATIERILRRETGLDLRLDTPNVHVMKMNSMEDLPRSLAWLRQAHEPVLVAVARTPSR